jgi:hypothetical protein
MIGPDEKIVPEIDPQGRAPDESDESVILDIIKNTAEFQQVKKSRSIFRAC